MASNGFLPRTDAGLLAWSANFSALITATPTAYGLTSAIATAYTALHTAYATALAACDPGVRNKAAVLAKNDAREALKVQARFLAKLVQGTSTVTDSQKAELGLTVNAMPSPIPPPSAAPALDIVSVVGRTVKIRLHDADNAGKRGKPAGVAGATVFSAVGDDAPVTEDGWKFEGNTTRTEIDVVFPNSVAAGAKVWLLAFWRNERDQSGPPCAPVSTNVQFGLPMAA
jgi:hypothetical protein